jgi:protoheme IX farnesyltransferase
MDEAASKHTGEQRSTQRVMPAYIDVLKPRETILLAFIGVGAAIIAGAGYPPLDRLLLAFISILAASAGANGITNYLDREYDAKMKRTRHRALPSGRISPPQKVLPLTIGLSVAGLTLAWFLHPLCFGFGALGTVAASTWRKKMTCVFPQGTIAGCAPILMGWFAINPTFNSTIIILCILIGIWIPLHVWSVMVANREDYRGAGLTYFPMSLEVKDVVKLFLILAIALYLSSLALYFLAGMGLLYLAVANILGIIMIFATSRLLVSKASTDAWRVYKLSAFPYLGLIFLVICLDIWLM